MCNSSNTPEARSGDGSTKQCNISKPECLDGSTLSSRLKKQEEEQETNYCQPVPPKRGQSYLSGGTETLARARQSAAAEVLPSWFAWKLITTTPQDAWALWLRVLSPLLPQRGCSLQMTQPWGIDSMRKQKQQYHKYKYKYIKYQRMATFASSVSPSVLALLFSSLLLLACNGCWYHERNRVCDAIEETVHAGPRKSHLAGVSLRCRHAKILTGQITPPGPHRRRRQLKNGQIFGDAAVEIWPSGGDFAAAWGRRYLGLFGSTSGRRYLSLGSPQDSCLL